MTKVTEDPVPASNTGSTSGHATALAEGHEKESSQTENRLRQLKAIKEREPLTDEEVDIINAFGHAMQPATEETAATAARRIDALIPPLNEVKRIGDWLYNMWNLMMNLVTSPDSGNYIQERLMSVLKHLRKLDRGKIKNRGIMKQLWANLPALNYALQPCFDDPTHSYVDDASTQESARTDSECDDASTQESASTDSECGDSFTQESARTWLNVTTFAARLLGADYCCFNRHAVVILGRALEMQPVPVKGITECRIEAACAWITYGARPLRQWAVKNVKFTNMLVQTDLAANPEFAYYWRALILPAGPLYDGPETICLQRWEFWIKRFEEIGMADSFISDEARVAALGAAKSMRDLEESMGNTLPA